MFEHTDSPEVKNTESITCESEGSDEKCESKDNCNCNLPKQESKEKSIDTNLLKKRKKKRAGTGNLPELEEENLIRKE
jgi:hypothetical protein